jgi:MFS family permease
VFGYNIGVMSGALAQLEDKFALSDVEAGLVMGALALGSVVGCVVGGPLCDSLLGRWRTIQLQNLVFLLGALLTAAAPSLALVVTGRWGSLCHLTSSVLV